MERDGDAVEWLRRVGVGRGVRVGVAIARGVGLGIAGPDGSELAVDVDDPAAVVARIETVLRPRWVWWSIETATMLVDAGLRIGACWDIAVVHRLLAGGWRADPALVWATLRELPLESIPVSRPLDLFTQAEPEMGDPEHPVRPDGYLRPDWVDGSWAERPERLARWAGLAAQAATLQEGHLSTAERSHAVATARAESAAELLCAELAAGGLPMDRDEAERIIAGFVGPRPRTDADAVAARRRRDDEVLRHAPRGAPVDLRHAAQVKSMLWRAGVDVPDTRAWRLQAVRDHPLVDALLTWRKAERIATTFGYGWIDTFVGTDGRLRGQWSSADGAAGRMTATAGLHNMPADLRPAVRAEPGHVLVRADLGQIEPRVLAAVSGDRALVRSTAAGDMYAPVAAQIGVDRDTAKVAVLGAMYGQTTGHGAAVLPRLHQSYPAAMRLLEAADEAGRAGRDIRTHGGRLIRLGAHTPEDDVDDPNEAGLRDARARTGARGRYARNAVIQGAAAELFKVWAVTVRARGAELDARIVLCLHDELLVHAPASSGSAVADLLERCLHEAVHRWSPDSGVHFVADIAVLERWSDATH